MSSGRLKDRTRKRLNLVHQISTAAASIAALALLTSLVFVAGQPALAQTESVLYSFSGPPDAYDPYAGVAIDKKGNLYGTSYTGGANGCGAVFKVTPTGSESVLYSFACGADGAYPYAVVPVLDKKGNIYGTTIQGGANGLGTVFKVTPTGSESVLHSFINDGTDGYYPYVGLAIDKKNNVYGTTLYGGANGVGTVFKVTPTGTETVLHTFASDGTDGFYPYTPVAVDKKGNVYGTTYYGGTNGYGTVFKVTPSGTETILHIFLADGTDGYQPYFSGIVLDKLGNIYGNTYQGGSNGGGTLYKVTPSGTETILHSFAQDGTDGYEPFGNLAIDTAGNLYGATYVGGSSSVGTVYKVSSTGVETILHNFTGYPDGAYAYVSGVVRDSKGNLYGTTYQGGANSYGTVYKVAP